MKDKNSNIENNKQLSSTKIVYLIIFLFVIGMIILFGSDAFNSPKAILNVSSDEQINDPHVHDGADLSKLQEIKTLEDRIIAEPNNTELILKLGHLLNDSGFYEKAIERYKKYLSVKPNEPDVIVDMGVCYFQLSDFNLAIEVMESAIKINPKHQIACFNLGIVNSAAGNHDEALDWWKKAVEIDANSNIGKKAKKLLEQH